MSGKTIEIQYSPQEYQREIHNDPHRFKVVIVGRRGGKTEYLINDTIMKAVTMPGLHWIVAPSYRQVKSIVWTRLKVLLKVDENWIFNEQELSATHSKIGTKIELRGADNEDSLRGVGLQSLAVDEAAMIKANVWPEILRPMLADTQGPATFFSTPKGRNWLYDLYIKEDPDWKSWHYPTNVNQYISENEIVEARKDMSERLFRQEFQAEFLDDETGVFKRVRQCITGELQKPIDGRFYVMGVDLAKSEDFTVLTVMDSIQRHVVYHERFNEISWREQKIKIQAVAAKYNNALCIIDSTGVGDPIFEDLQNSNVSVEGYRFDNTSKNKLIDNLSIAIEQRRVTFPRIDVLVEELMNYEYSISAHGRIIYNAPAGKHDDCVISLGLAAWGLRYQLHEAQVLQRQEELLSAQDRQGLGREVIEEEEEDYICSY